MSSVDLATTYLGLRLANPFITGASPLSDHLDTVRRLEDAGCAAIVLHSLFEEQITQAETGRIRRLDPLDPEFAGVVSYFPDPEAYALKPHEYLEHLRRVKEAVRIPVIGSLNGTTAEAWLKFAGLIEQAGADALELNVYEVNTDPSDTAITIEEQLRQIVRAVTSELRIPVAVKLSPYFTAFANLVRQLDVAGASGLVLFNRFLQPDIDVQHMAVWPRLELSTNAELLLRLRWLAILRGQTRRSLAATGGVATPSDGIKAILAGADAVQMVSAILRHGPSYFRAMREGLARWMESLGIARLDDVRGRLSLARTEEPAAFERAQYVRTLSKWSSWFGYEAQRGMHDEDESKLPS
ncbi:MAG TPA: dihydroorotate dehydrogenase-like protein [Vicinamibacterales bacterium]